MTMPSVESATLTHIQTQSRPYNWPEIFIGDLIREVGFQGNVYLIQLSRYQGEKVNIKKLLDQYASFAYPRLKQK